MKKIIILVFMLMACKLSWAFGTDGKGAYKKHCASCHDLNNSQIPSFSLLSRLSPNSIHDSLTKGSMRQFGVALSEIEKKSVAEFISGKQLAADDGIDKQLQFCASRPPLKDDFLARPGWNGWGVDLENTRYQAAAGAGLDDSHMDRLELRWVFAYPGEVLALGPVTVGGERLYVPSQGGNIYALDAKTGCAHWRFKADSSVRTAVNIGKAGIPGHDYLLYFTDSTANTYALDADSGELVWKTRVESHPAVRVTGSAQLYRDTLYIPISTLESVTAASPDYQCCTHRGSIVAVAAPTGEILWQSHTIREIPAPSAHTNADGQAFYGPSGAGIWSAPTIDSRLNVLYVGTGENSSEPATSTSDAVLAMDLADGRILWSYQGTPNDAWNSACLLEERRNCPAAEGPDYDFGASPVLVDIDDNRRVLIAAQKSGVVHALDPDSQGKLLWKQQASPGGFQGGVMWGIASDGENIYIPLSDRVGKLIVDADGRQDWILDPSQGGGLHAYRVSDGKLVWKAAPAVCRDRPQCSPAQAGAVSVIPGVVFSGAYDGHIRGYSTRTGEVIWDYDTVRSYKAVNGIKAQGGALDGAGPTIVNGMIYVNSGYARWGGMPGNALLAFRLRQ